MYQEGRGVPLNYSEAVKWYWRSADSGDAKAQFQLAQMCAPDERSQEISLKRSAAHALLDEAASGDAEAQYFIFQISEKIKNKSERNKQMRFWLERSAEQGYAPALTSLGGITLLSLNKTSDT